MPRLSPSVIRQALSRSGHLARLLRECRDLESATNELRWLAEYASENGIDNKVRHANYRSTNARLKQYVRRRSRGEPLQYILGSQPFGELDIICRPGVLIPRPETELYTSTLARLICQLMRDGVIQMHQPTKILDLCTGSGCIALLLHAILHSPHIGNSQPPMLEILGADVSPLALQLAQDNLLHNIEGKMLDVSSKHEISFQYLDVLEAGGIDRATHSDGLDVSQRHKTVLTRLLKTEWDVIVSNPPYISPSDYAPGGTVTRSVRNYEPRLALVPPSVSPTTTNKRPPDRADQFYASLMNISHAVKARLLVMEIGDSHQAARVRGMTAEHLSDQVLIETWRDDGSVDVYDPINGPIVPACNAASAPERAVVVWMGEWKTWRSKSEMLCR